MKTLETKLTEIKLIVGSTADYSRTDLDGHHFKVPEPKGAVFIQTGMDGCYHAWRNTAESLAKEASVDVIVTDLRNLGFAKPDRLVEDAAELQGQLAEHFDRENFVRVGHSQSCWVQAHATDLYRLPTSGFYFLAPYPDYPEWLHPLPEPARKFLYEIFLKYRRAVEGPLGMQLKDANIDPSIPTRYVMGAFDVGLGTVFSLTRARYSKLFKEQAPHAEIGILDGNHNMNQGYFVLDRFNEGNHGNLIEDMALFTQRTLYKKPHVHTQTTP